MSLEEKFKEIIFNYDYVPNTMTQSAKQCVQICDEFAVGFAEWMHSNCGYAGNGHWVIIGHTSYHTIPKLLEIYKQGL